ncbi:MAG: hypothetical protein AABY16_03410 [Nanoarchaeota archaeon]
MGTYVIELSAIGPGYDLVKDGVVCAYSRDVAGIVRAFIEIRDRIIKKSLENLASQEKDLHSE